MSNAKKIIDYLQVTKDSSEVDQLFADLTTAINALSEIERCQLLEYVLNLNFSNHEANLKQIIVSTYKNTTNEHKPA